MNNEKIFNIVQQIAASLDIKLHEKENSSSTLRFEGRTKGIEVFLYFSTQTRDKSKVQAYFCVGSSRHYYEPRFSKKITFSDTKSEHLIFKDLMQRLEMEKIKEKVDNIFSYRSSEKDKKDLEQAELSIFQKFLPFEKVDYKQEYVARKNGAVFSLSSKKEELNIYIINKDILIRICAAAAKILEEEAAKA